MQLINTNNFIACDAEFKSAKTIIFGAPFDGTTSYRPGTRFGPSYMRRDSFSIETYSPSHNKDLEDCNVCDLGDLDLPFGNAQRVIDMVEKQTADILAKNKFPIMLGGEHLVSLGAIKAALKKHLDLHIVHFDAHADLREDYLGERLSHSTVMRRAYCEICGGTPKTASPTIRIFQFGIRSGTREEFEFAKKHTHLTQNNFDSIANLAKQIGNAPVYLTIDLDVLDPSEFPGTGTPEAGGVTYKELLAATKMVFSTLNVVAADMVELNPMVDTSGISTALACKYLREIILLKS